MRPPLVLLGALAAVVCGAAVALVLVLLAAPGEPRRAEAAPEVVAEEGVGELTAVTTALSEWDDARARAWASGDLRALAGLYTDASGAGERDVAMLRRWRDRGLVVRDLRTEVLALEVEQADDERVVLLVTDRLAGGAAVGRGRPLALPHDQPTRRRVVLVRDDAAWRVSSVLPVDVAAAVPEPGLVR